MYLTNKTLIPMMKASKEADQPTPELVKAFQLIADKVINKYNYNDYEDKKDCVATAVYDQLLYWRNFDFEKSDQVFQYLTSIVFNGIKKGWKQQHPKEMNKALRIDHLPYVSGLF